jgi:hypothetical protein
MLTGVPLYAGGLLVNGGFETGDFTGWTTGGNFEDTYVMDGSFYVFGGAQEGTYYTVMGPVGSDGTLSQTFSDTAGTPYTFSFWLAAADGNDGGGGGVSADFVRSNFVTSGGGDNPSDFGAYWNGSPLLSLTNPSTDGVWNQVSFTVTGTGSDTVSFSFMDDPAYLALDNVSVSSSAIPEPASLTLLAGGLLALAFRLRRRK